ncbi:MAG: DNA polymerase Y family protein, partial [Pirellulaceae bacterium]
MKRMLCIWFPHWPLQRLLVAKPELEQRAVILYSRWGNRGQRVTACSAQAAAAGVRPGMPLAEATALLHQLSPERGSPASVAARSKSRAAAPPSGSAFYTEASQETADRAELQRLAAWCERFSPIVGLESTSDPAGGDPPEPASLILDVSGLGPLFGGEASLGTRIVAELEQQGYASRVAIADSLGAAWAVAHGALPEQAPGCWVVPPGQTAATLESYPLHVLRLPESTCETLQQLGIQQIRQLLRLPRPSLLARFGPTILLRLDQALGILQEPITTHRAAPIFEASWSLEYPTDQRSAIEFVVQQLIQRVAHLLAEQHRGAVRLEVHLRCISPSSDSQSVSDGESELGSPVPATPRPQLVFRVDLFRPTAVC